MSDNNRGSSFHGAVKSLLNDFLALFVEGGRGFIKNQDLWVLDECSCDCNALFLTTGEFATLEAADFEEARMKALLLSLDLLFIDQICEHSLIVTLNSRAAL